MLEQENAGIQSVRRATTILDMLAGNSGDMTLVEISRRLQLHRSTAHHLLSTLKACRYVEQNPETRRYTLGRRIYELAAADRRRSDLVEIAKPFLEEVHQACNETVLLGIRRGADCIVATRLESTHPLRISWHPGQRLSLYCSALGKALLCRSSEEEVRDILEGVELAKLTPNTITTIETLLTELRLTRERGYSTDLEEREVGVACVGAPIVDEEGSVAGSVSISAPLLRFTQIKHKLVELLTATANRIQSALRAD